jgi:2-oxoglutarate ferredoxin oxidoreductase subunit alpha
MSLNNGKSKVNDFVVRFANVNGTGSASANHMFAKAVFRMGVPVTPKNIFPSNIQGLPTWYDVRVSEKGYLGRREGIDFMVCMNPQSIKADVNSVLSGGYFMYDSTKALHSEYLRNDIHYIGIPFTAICNKEYSDPRQRQLFKNIVYIGALSTLLNIEFSVLEDLVGAQFKGKEKLIPPNIHALELGVQYVKENFKYPLDIRLERRSLLKDKIMVNGNTAAGIGAVYAGATVASWYPITPSTSLVEAFEKYANELRIDGEGRKKFAVIQAEDELAALGMAIGANWNGARSFTATSGPGLSLMNEFLGLAYFAEVPVVLADVQRTGPSTGMPTRTQQSDILLAAYASHGDTKHILLLPSTPAECFDMMAQAFDLADQLQTPVLLMTDLDLGMNDHVCDPFAWDKDRKYKKGKVLTAGQLQDIEKYGRYLDTDNDGIPYRTIPGTHATKGSYFTRGSSHDEYAVYTEDAPSYVRSMERLLKKHHTAKALVPAPKFYQKENSHKNALLFYGTTTPSAEEAMDILKDKDFEFDAVRVKAFPFNLDLHAFIEEHEHVFVIEQNRDGQLRTLLMNELGIDPKKLKTVLNFDGNPITAHFIVTEILSMVLPVPKLKEAIVL